MGHMFDDTTVYRGCTRIMILLRYSLKYNGLPCRSGPCRKGCALPEFVSPQCAGRILVFTLADKKLIPQGILFCSGSFRKLFLSVLLLTLSFLTGFDSSTHQTVIDSAIGVGVRANLNLRLYNQSHCV